MSVFLQGRRCLSTVDSNVRLADLVRPKPGELIAPLAKRIEDVSSTVEKSVAHDTETIRRADGASVIKPAIVVFEIVDPPLCVCERIELLIAPRTRIEGAIQNTRTRLLELFDATSLMRLTLHRCRCQILNPCRECGSQGKGHHQEIS